MSKSVAQWIHTGQKKEPGRARNILVTCTGNEEVDLRYKHYFKELIYYFTVLFQISFKGAIVGVGTSGTRLYMPGDGVRISSSLSIKVDETFFVFKLEEEIKLQFLMMHIYLSGTHLCVYCGKCIMTILATLVLIDHFFTCASRQIKFTIVTLLNSILTLIMSDSFFLLIVRKIIFELQKILCLFVE